MKMKKLIMLIGVIISIAFQVAASSEGVIMTTYRKGYADKSTTVHRSPMHLPIEVFYDSETRQVEISSEDEMNVTVYLLDVNGNTMDSSSSINTILNVPEGFIGNVVILIEGEDWIAIGEITA